MSAPAVDPRPEAQHVRVTFDGKARPLPHAPNLLRVELGSRTVVIDTADPDVRVDYPTPPRVWTDGDVVQHSADTWTLTRERGRWLSTRRPNDLDTWTDEKVSAALIENSNGWGRLTILRYQHGGE